MSAFETQRIRRLLGREQALDVVSHELKYFVQELRAPMVGAHLVTCSDESEQECAKSFQQCFAQDLLPHLRLADKALFRTANLGGRYEWGGVRIAEQHFSAEFAAESFKVIVLKINAHVAVERNGNNVHFGSLERYGAPSFCCGALHGVLSHVHLPAFDDLREMLTSEHEDRIALLNDPTCVDPQYRILLAAVVSARLQARRAIIDIQDYTPTSPTVYVIVPCVTLNRVGGDTEIACGIYTVDHRTEETVEEYCGLGDNPAKFTVKTDHGRVTVSDEGLAEIRQARDHRAMVLNAWRTHEDRPLPKTHELTTALKGARKTVAGNAPHAARIALRALLPVLTSVAPIPAAILLFAGGALGIHHLYRLHRLSKDIENDDEARRILEDFSEMIDKLPPERAKAVVELLASQYD